MHMHTYISKTAADRMCEAHQMVPHSDAAYEVKAAVGVCDRLKEEKFNRVGSTVVQISLTSVQ